MSFNLLIFLLNKSGKDTKISFIFWRRKNTSNIIALPTGSICGCAMIQARLQQYVNCELPDVQDGFGDGQEGLACCNSWDLKESDTTEQLT